MLRRQKHNIERADLFGELRPHERRTTRKERPFARIARSDLTGALCENSLAERAGGARALPFLGYTTDTVSLEESHDPRLHLLRRLLSSFFILFIAGSGRALRRTFSPAT